MTEHAQQASSLTQPRPASGSRSEPQTLGSVEHGRELVALISRRFHGRGLEADDLEQVGYLGYMEAQRRADMTRKETFTAFAAFWIEKAIREAVADTGRSVRLPRKRLAQIIRLKRSRAALETELGRPATTAEVAARLQLDVRIVEALEADAVAVVSLDALSDEGFDLAGALDEPRDPEEGNDYDWLHGLLDQLDPFTREILDRRVGLRGHEPATLETVGRSLGLSRETVRAYERDALEWLTREASRLRTAA